MIPFDYLPGAKQWVGGLPRLVAHLGPIWIYGPHGSGVSTLAKWLADQRGTKTIENNSDADLAPWLEKNPLGVVASKQAKDATNVGARFDFLELRLWAISDDPSTMQKCLEHIAIEEGIEPPLPPALACLPCNGNLRELRNRIVRWHILGQLPEPFVSDAGPQLFDAEDIASNLHIMERTLLYRALRRSYGNRAQAAKRLGICRRQLYLLIGRHGDPVRGELPVSIGPKRLAKFRHNLIGGNNRH